MSANGLKPAAELPGVERLEGARPSRGHKTLFGLDRVALAIVLLIGIAASTTLVTPTTAAAHIDVKSMAQTDHNWTSDTLGTCSTNLGLAGCAVTSEAMVFNFYGISVTSSKGTGMTPAILNAWLTENAGYAYDKDGSGNCDLFGGNLPQPAGIKLGVPDLNVSHLDSELAAGRPVIAHVTGSGTSGHFVVITGKDGNTYDINDPGKGSQTTLDQGDYGSYTVDQYQYFSRSGTQTVTAPPATPPAAPSNMSATALSSSSLKFSWQDNSSNETSFDVYRWSGSAWAKVASPAANSPSWTDTGLAAST